MPWKPTKSRYIAKELCEQYAEKMETAKPEELVPHGTLVRWYAEGVSYLADMFYDSTFAMDDAGGLYIVRFHGVDNPHVDDLIATQDWLDSNWRLS
jgi:hypothetical protein